MTPTPPTVLVFAANDPSGGAGLMADILTLASLGCHALPIVTAMTVQDTAGVQSFQAVDSEFVDEQARFILEDIKIDAIKVGMVGSVENLAVIAEIASDYPDIPLILEPVFSMGRGEELSDEDLYSAMRELLLPHSFLVTCNSDDARKLGTDDPDEQEDLPLDAAAQRMLQCGCEYVLIAGTHEKTPKVVNTLYSAMGRVRSDKWERLPGSFHGAGATLASAMAGALANGADIATAMQEAQEYTFQAISNAYRPGMGQMIPDRMFWARPPAEEVPVSEIEIDGDEPKSVQ
ncbi:hydroxymethylpyrimidine/phosphomethylpyrimidine kinase [Chitinibacter bivalviorum]|uniref:hydroxymethylpyrimidine kinase n=1 Tax=Chitinibacter bivalviorum TaxID=2739434 RepID=A0A7H9BKJ1_9NEIS|nr:hydroxymethylpyrimidine/phosphomethylpyrimidine kinase [Chitinibacter bivalviorum]QLG89195.1 hydroxymethylpyrimidine/phosphomethylpyrimidine kinase [Chitinibacter bivalviorum]